MTGLKLPTWAWLERTFPARLIALWIVAAALLTSASSLIPRPAYDRAGLSNLRYGYPMPYVIQNRSALRPQSYPVFVSWIGAPATLEPALGVVNIAFYLTAFALDRVLLRRNSKENTVSDAKSSQATKSR